MKVVIKPDAVDGLSRIQRAILRYYGQKTVATRTWRMIKDLMSSPDCPAGVTHLEIDAVAMTMANPVFNSRPVLSYIGSPTSNDGWIQGTIYAAMGINMLGRGLLADGGHWGADWWDPEPLKLYVPFALVFGAATWEIELDDGQTEYHNQLARQIRCREVHVLGMHEERVDRAMYEYQENGDLGTVGQPSESRTYKGIEVPGDLVLPRGPLCHGQFLGVANDGDEWFVVSCPVIRSLGLSNEDLYGCFIQQPRLGYHVGDEIDEFVRAGGTIAERWSPCVTLPAPPVMSDMTNRVQFCPLPPADIEMMLCGHGIVRLPCEPLRPL